MAPRRISRKVIRNGTMNSGRLCLETMERLQTACLVGSDSRVIISLATPHFRRRIAKRYGALHKVSCSLSLSCAARTRGGGVIEKATKLPADTDCVKF